MLHRTKRRSYDLFRFLCIVGTSEAFGIDIWL